MFNPVVSLLYWRFFFGIGVVFVGFAGGLLVCIGGIGGIGGICCGCAAKYSPGGLIFRFS